MKDVTFSFDTFSVADKKLIFTYSYQDAAGATIGSFEEYYLLPVNLDTTDQTIQFILKQLHIIVGISYYKSLLGNVKLTYELSEQEAEFWNSVYDKGLGEFAYVNKLDEPIRPFTPNATATTHSPVLREGSGALLGIGGGKDSIVAGELLKKLQIDTTTIDVASRDNHGQAGKVMEVMGFPQLRVERYLDTSIVNFTETHQGYNGHIPLSVILAWIGILLAYTTNKKYVILANEASSSVGNTTWNGREVNHQWAKSLEFETMMKEFVNQTVSSDISYFSLIRPFGSLAVLALFAKLGTDYLQKFTSCNLVLRIDPAKRPNGRWCCKCAKCLSSWLLLSVWFSKAELVSIFGSNLLEDTSLRPTLHELLGLSGHKPLDCVGTTEELRAATRQLLAQKDDNPLLEDIAIEQIPGPSIDELVGMRTKHLVPADIFSQTEKVITDLI